MKKKINCGYCKKEIKKNSKKCPHCGKEFEMFKKSKKWLVNNWGVFVGAIFGLMVLPLMLFFAHKFVYVMYLWILPLSITVFIFGDQSGAAENPLLTIIVSIILYALIGWGIHALIRKLIKLKKNK